MGHPWVNGGVDGSTLPRRRRRTAQPHSKDHPYDRTRPTPRLTPAALPSPAYADRAPGGRRARRPGDAADGPRFGRSGAGRRAVLAARTVGAAQRAE
ncbi:hypothetical protein GCM10010371_47270 [Streptomyces subrutilus]|uniref:Uncharacterized protein n=1 Tax=Streptomyces subrutilus TaxID=36818 RepID=A0A918R249_9ACTN|nr:hypothetical protein GCM10010371_47270 [Streptomyces subrutilus]